MNFADHLTAYAEDIAQAKARIGRQAAKRAAANDGDPVSASMLAEDLYTPGCCHETIVERVSGAYRRKAA